MNEPLTKKTVLTRREMLVGTAGLLGLAVVGRLGFAQSPAKPAHHFPVTKTDAEWKKILTPEQYYILRQQGTEAPGSGKYDQFWQKGTYVCAACANPLFSSDTKYDPHEGWPSFWKTLSPKSVYMASDNSLGMSRTEVECARCGGHLGHLFDDGPKPTGLRYCMDSAALKFVAAKK